MHQDPSANNQSATVPSFRDIALPLAQRGIKVIPVRPLSKRGVLQDQFKYATTSAEQIERWHAENPDYNVGCVGTPDGIAILDCDVKGLMRRIEQETGHEFPKTLVVRSAGKGCAHIYFRQTDASRKLGNKKRAGLFDLQSVDKYVVGAGSRLENGKTYDIVKDAPISEFPDWLAAWVRANADADKPKTEVKDARPVDESFDIADFLEHYGIGYRQDGNWYITDVCPVSGRKHEQSTRTGFFFDGNSVGFHCFASGCEGNSMTVGQVIRHLNQENDPYPSAIWEEQPVEELVEILESIGVEQEGAAAETAVPEEEKQECLRGGCNCGLRHPIREEAAAALAESQPDEDEDPEPESDPGQSFVLVKGRKSDGSVITLRGIRASDIKDEALEWLWPDRIPLGKITWFAGKPDCGKSVTLIDFVARISSGADFPDGSKNPWGPRKVLLGCTEDGLGDTVKPRLVGAGANLENVIVLDSNAIGTKKGDSKKQRMLKLSEDIGLLKATLKSMPDIILVALDPITGYFGDADSNKDKEIRPVMDKLAKACNEMRVTFISVMHQNKRSDVDAIHKILGASSVAGSARTAWGFSRDKEEKDICHMVLIKNNLSKKRTGLDYKLVSKAVLAGGKMVEHPCIEWLGENDDTADDLMDKERESRRNGGESKKLDAAKAFLRMKFSDKKQHKCVALYSDAEAGGITDRTLKRARMDLLKSGELITSVDDRRGQGNGYWWIVPDKGNVMELIGDVL